MVKMSTQVNGKPGKVCAATNSFLKLSPQRMKRARAKKSSPPELSVTRATLVQTSQTPSQPPPPSRIYGRGPCTDPRLKVASDLKLLIKQKEYSDVVIVAGDKKFDAHRVLLAARSSYFAKELKASAGRPSHLLVSNLRPGVFEQVLSFIYSGEVSDGVEMKELFLAGVELSLPDLRDLATKNMAAQLSVNNVIDILVLAHEHHAQDLKLQAMQYFNRNAAQLMKTDGYKILVSSHLALIEELYRNSHGVLQV